MKVHYGKIALKCTLCVIAALLVSVSAWGLKGGKETQAAGGTGEVRVGPAEPLQAVISDGQIADVDMPIYNINLDMKWQKLSYELCKKNYLNYEMVLSFFELESEGFQLRLICYNRDGNGNVLSYDSGIAQINSKYVSNYRQHAITYCGLDPKVKFDPLNPDHGIRAGIGGLAFYRDYWLEQGITDENQLFQYSLNSYNMGPESYQKYVTYSGQANRKYNIEIAKRMEVLDKKWQF